MTKRLMLAVVLAGALVAVVGAQSALDFTLVNRTGYGIAEIYVAPSASSEWGITC
jgi:hypothetical protein